MANTTSDKHMVRIESPTGLQLSIAYSTLKEAQHQSPALERQGYKILGIVSVPLPKPNL